VVSWSIVIECSFAREVEVHLNAVLQNVIFVTVRYGVLQKQKQNCSFAFVFAVPLGTAQSASFFLHAVAVAVAVAFTERD
jgi:hypothetical protein